MKRPWILILISVNLLAFLALTFLFPHLMVSPGALVEGHAELSADCFACHSPFQGATPDRCVACHAVADIGLHTTAGVPIAKPNIKVSFHQELVEQDCMACHSDHAGPMLTHRSRKPFSHDLLRTEVRERCESCHVAEDDAIHRDLANVRCGQCHQKDRWKPATFDHAVLDLTQQDSCNACHRPPTDSLHKQITSSCKQCHSLDRWKPATYDHNKLFVLDRDHNATCETCHVNNDYSRYTCYGCHEHTQAGIRAEHQEEGIRNFENCVKCHRSADDEPEGGDSHEGGDRD